MSEDEEITKQLPEESNSETSLNDSSIYQSETRTTNMEVHHHPNLEKKNFKDSIIKL